MVRLATKLAWARSCPDPGTRTLINHEMLQEEKSCRSYCVRSNDCRNGGYEYLLLLWTLNVRISQYHGY